MNESNLALAWQLLPLGLWETIYMVIVSGFFATLVGLPLGIFLAISGPGQIREAPVWNKTLNILINIGRSFPFAILMVALIPFTRWIVGTSLGTTASIVPLAVAAAPFVARVVETALQEIDKQVVDAAIVMGSTHSQVIKKVLLMEALPSLIGGFTLTLINLIGYSAMAGLVGGGGLGKIAIQYGYQRFNGFIMLITVALLIILVGLVQWGGNRIVLALLKKRGKLSHE